jgi:outer membrane protein TolC
MRRGLCLLGVIVAVLPIRAAEVPPSPGRVITLEEAYDLAAATDQSIRIAYEQIRIANLQTWQALTVLGPQLTGVSEYSSRQTHGSGIIMTNNAGSLGLNFQQQFLNFSVFPAFHLGKLEAVGARLQQQFTIRQVLFGVAKAYYQVISDEGVVKVDQKTVDLAAEQLDVAQKRLNVGEVTPTDALNAKVTLESAKVALIQAQNTLLLDRDTLGNMLNVGGDSGFQVVTPADYPTTIPPFEKLLAIAYRNREDLAVGNIVVVEDISKKGEVVAEYLPQVMGQASDSYDDGRGFRGPQSQVWDGSISVTMPFFTGGQREIDLKTAGVQVDIDRLNRDEIAKTVEAAVRSAWLNASSLRDSLVSLRLQVDAAQESYEDEVHEYQAGTAASVDVLTSLVSLNTSENSLAVQVYLYQVALRNLEEAAGVFQEQRVQQEKVK